jgi:cytochrome c biogenesis protein CcdA
LTSSTALVLLVLLAIEGVTVLRVGSLLTLHVFIGMLLVPPVVVKLASTFWRFAKYYTGSREYREKGPPPAVLRVLGPFVAMTTIILFASGIVLLLAPLAWRPDTLLVHQASFVVWFGCMTIHVLAHIRETAQLSTKDWVRRTRARVAGARSRRLVMTTSLAIGVVLAFLTIPTVGPWLSAR